MNNQKLSSKTSLIENGQTIEGSQQKTEILNKCFASESNVSAANDDVPVLKRNENIPLFDSLNTSPLETANIAR